MTLCFLLYISKSFFTYSTHLIFFSFLWRKNATPVFSRSLPTWACNHTPPDFLELYSITHLLIWILTSSLLSLFPSKILMDFFLLLNKFRPCKYMQVILLLFLQNFNKAQGLSSVFIHSTTPPSKEPLLSTYYALNTWNGHMIITEGLHSISWGGERDRDEETDL